MPTYDYKCDNCGHEINDIFQSFSDPSLTTCDACGKECLQRVIYGGIAVFVKDIKTVGQAADANWKKMGHYQKSEIEQSRKDQNKEKESPLSAFGSASRKQINKMTPEQQKKYIITGET